MHGNATHAGEAHVVVQALRHAQQGDQLCTQRSVLVAPCELRRAPRAASARRRMALAAGKTRARARTAAASMLILKTESEGRPPQTRQRRRAPARSTSALRAAAFSAWLHKAAHSKLRHAPVDSGSAFSVFRCQSQGRDEARGCECEA
jgi:hypothetical protein